MNGGTITGLLISLVLILLFIIWVISLTGMVEVDPNLLLYIAYCAIVGISGSGVFFGNGQVVTGVMFLIGSILIFTYFGQRWFSSPGFMETKKNIPWPPYINTCPDYLYYYNNQGQDTCVDPIGVSINNGIQKLPPGPINNSNPAYFFNLTAGMAKGDVTKSKGLTWEGITDGISTNITPSQNTVPGAGTACPSN
jgi:hypothetical protein